MKDEELLKRFLKDFLRRRELKKSADGKKREERKRREEGINVKNESDGEFSAR